MGFSLSTKYEHDENDDQQKAEPSTEIHTIC